ncbi:hypothetical protein LINPERHAP1_LOCUS36487 [Linum perenne]
MLIQVLLTSPPK